MQRHDWVGVRLFEDGDGRFVEELDSSQSEDVEGRLMVEERKGEEEKGV